MSSSTLAKRNDGTAKTNAEPPINNTQPTLAELTASLYLGKETEDGPISDAEESTLDSPFQEAPSAQGGPKKPGDPGSPDGSPLVDETYLASEICLQWNKSLDGVFEVGKLLNKAAKLFSKRYFRKNFVEKLPFTYSVAQRLRKLARSERLNNPKYRQLLPFSWNTLAAIDNLSEAAFLYGVEQGIITPKCQYKDIRKLRDEFSEPSESEDGSSSATVEAPKGPQAKRLHDIKTKVTRHEAKLANTPQPLFISVSAVLLAYHRSELAKLVEDLNQQLPQEYSFISEVRMEERK